MNEAEEIRALADMPTEAWKPLDAETGRAATAYLKRMLIAEEAGDVRWDDRLKDWVMTWRHPMWQYRDIL